MRHGLRELTEKSRGHSPCPLRLRGEKEPGRRQGCYHRCHQITRVGFPAAIRSCVPAPVSDESSVPFPSIQPLPRGKQFSASDRQAGMKLPTSLTGHCRVQRAYRRPAAQGLRIPGQTAQGDCECHGSAVVFLQTRFAFKRTKNDSPVPLRGLLCWSTASVFEGLEMSTINLTTRHV